MLRHSQSHACPRDGEIGLKGRSENLFTPQLLATLGSGGTPHFLGKPNTQQARLLCPTLCLITNYHSTLSCAALRVSKPFGSGRKKDFR